MISRLFCLLMAVVVINSSIDVADVLLYPVSSAAHTAPINEMESVVELLAECVLNIEDAFPEQRNDDSGHFFLKKLSSAKHIQQLKYIIVPVIPYSVISVHPVEVAANSSLVIDLVSPPPKG